ncbi:Rz-like lysis system protein LysB, partial [Serratia marcescens]
MSRAIRWFLVLALVVAGWMKWQVVTLGERLESARQENGRMAAALTDTRAAIDTLQAAAGRLAQEEEKLRGDLNAAHRLA